MMWHAGSCNVLATFLTHATTVDNIGLGPCAQCNVDESRTECTSTNCLSLLLTAVERTDDTVAIRRQNQNRTLWRVCSVDRRAAQVFVFITLWLRKDCFYLIIMLDAWAGLAFEASQTKNCMMCQVLQCANQVLYCTMLLQVKLQVPLWLAFPQPANPKGQLWAFSTPLVLITSLLWPSPTSRARSCRCHMASCCGRVAKYPRQPQVHRRLGGPMPIIGLSASQI
jgi:hypothetical protein